MGFYSKFHIGSINQSFFVLIVEKDQFLLSSFELPIALVWLIEFSFHFWCNIVNDQSKHLARFFLVY